MKKEILKWQSLTNKITEQWIREVWELVIDEEVEYDWVSEEVGSIFNFSDYWFNFSDVLRYYELGINREQLLNWYDTALEQSMSGLPTMNLQTFIKFPQEKEEQKKKHLETLKNRIKEAEQELEKAFEEYER